MAVMTPLKSEIPEGFYDNLEKESKNLRRILNFFPKKLCP